jgi:hypothetical protein
MDELSVAWWLCGFEGQWDSGGRKIFTFPKLIATASLPLHST